MNWVKRIAGAAAGIIIMLVILLRIFGNTSFPDPLLLDRTTLTETAKMLRVFKADCGEYPSAENGLKALLSSDSAECQNYSSGGYMKAHPTDRWGRPITYEPTPDGFLLSTLGRDGQPDGTGESADQIYDSSTSAIIKRDE